MSNFYDWLSKTINDDEVEVFLNMNNIFIEKIDLFLDIIISLHKVIAQTYMGDFDNKLTKLEYSSDDITNHFNWCWHKIISDFEKEGVIINSEGEHREYLKLFYNDSFYLQSSEEIRGSIERFFTSIFNLDNINTTKADLDILNEMYKMIDKNIKFKDLNC